MNVLTSNFLNITFWPKIEFWTCQTSQKTEQFSSIKLFVPRLVWSHNNRTELRTLLNITFWPKTELRTCRTSQKTEQFANIKLFVPRLVWSHNYRAKLQTLPNITVWFKTELRTCRTSPKNRTVLEHRTVCSKTKPEYAPN